MRVSSRLPAVAAALAAFLAACSSTRVSAQAMPAAVRLGRPVRCCFIDYSRRVRASHGRCCTHLQA